MLFHNLKLDKLIERERARPSGRFSSRLGGRMFWIYFFPSFPPPLLWVGVWYELFAAPVLVLTVWFRSHVLYVNIACEFGGTCDGWLAGSMRYTGISKKWETWRLLCIVYFKSSRLIICRSMGISESNIWGLT